MACGKPYDLFLPGNGERDREKDRNSMPPSLDTIFTALELAKARAQALAQTHPEHEDVIRKFMKDLHQMGIELNDGEYDETRFRSSQDCSPGRLHFIDLYLSLGQTDWAAEQLYEEHPAYIFPLKRFQEEITRVWRQLFRNVGRPWEARLMD